MARSMSRRCPTLTISGSGRSAPTRSRAAVWIGRTVAERPMRCRRAPRAATSSASRSSERARCAPRLSPATAWISSTITVRTSASQRRLDSAVSRMKSDSGVVTITCGGRRPIRRRSWAGVSPVRTAVRISRAGSPAATAAAASSASGSSRLRRTSLESALSGET